MEALRYNGQVGATANNDFGQWVIPEWCPKHADADAGESEKKCYCTRPIGDEQGQVPERVAKIYVSNGSHERVTLDEPEPSGDPLD